MLQVPSIKKPASHGRYLAVVKNVYKPFTLCFVVRLSLQLT